MKSSARSGERESCAAARARDPRPECEDCRMAADERLRAGRLAAQRLTPATACTSAEDAAVAVIGVQAQDLRAAALALRSRVPGLTRSDVRAAPLLRTWTVRGTVHLIAASDRPWLHALFASRNVRVGARSRASASWRRYAYAGRRELCGEHPRDRPSLLRALVERGHPSLEQGPINTLVPVALDAGAHRHRHCRTAARGRSAPGGRRRRGTRDPRRPLPRRLRPLRRNRPREVVLAAHHTGAPGARSSRTAERR